MIIGLHVGIACFLFYTCCWESILSQIWFLPLYMTASKVRCGLFMGEASFYLWINMITQYVFCFWTDNYIPFLLAHVYVVLVSFLVLEQYLIDYFYNIQEYEICRLNCHFFFVACKASFWDGPDKENYTGESLSLDRKRCKWWCSLLIGYSSGMLSIKFLICFIHRKRAMIVFLFFMLIIFYI